MKADLHMHSTSSDGNLSSFDVIKRAKENHCDIIAITDHDICTLVEENKKVAKDLGVTYIPGIELSTTCENRPVHVLGYFRGDSYKNEEMINYYKEIKEARENRAKKFIKNLKEFFNIEITYEEVFSYSRGVVARPHMAKAIVNNYPEYAFDEVFIKFIGDNSKAYVPTCELSVKEGIDLLRRNNCVVVLAHPTLLKPNIKDFVLKHDFDGFEGVYFRNKPGDEEEFRKIAKDRNLIITGGSDFHRLIDDDTHGDIGQIFIEGTDLTKFLKIYNN
jgi:predicted metal-dependent phosphoesterase TrpH